jgi:hypothetical protein
MTDFALMKKLDNYINIIRKAKNVQRGCLTTTFKRVILYYIKNAEFNTSLLILYLNGFCNIDISNDTDGNKLTQYILAITTNLYGDVVVMLNSFL